MTFRDSSHALTFSFISRQFAANTELGSGSRLVLLFGMGLRFTFRFMLLLGIVFLVMVGVWRR